MLTIGTFHSVCLYKWNELFIYVYFAAAVEKMSPLGSSVAAAVSSRGKSRPADQSQSNPGESTTEEPAVP